MKLLGHPFEVTVADIEETYLPGETPARHVKRLSEEKVREAAKTAEKSIIIGSDTVVVLDGEILGKPRTQSEAFDMIMRLQGRTHEVYTGFALLESDTGRMVSDFERTDVTMRPITPELVHRYLATGEPEDKAGAYGIQGYGAVLIASVRGCYFTVMGLPLARLMETLNVFSEGLFGYFGTHGER